MTKLKVLYHLYLTVVLCLAVSACSSLPLKKPQAPIVSIVDVRPLNLSFTQQKLAFKLNVKNPNAYDLPLEGLDFVASFAGQQVATGESDDEVILPANDSTTVEVDVVVALDRFVSRFQSMLNSGDINLGYDIKGNVKLGNWPTRIPFDVEGNLETPDSE